MSYTCLQIRESVESLPAHLLCIFLHNHFMGLDKMSVIGVSESIINAFDLSYHEHLSEQTHKNYNKFISLYYSLDRSSKKEMLEMTIYELIDHSRKMPNANKVTI